MVRKIKRNNKAKIKKQLAKSEKNLQNSQKTDISNIINNQKKSFKPDKIVWGLTIFTILIIILILFINNAVQQNKQKNTTNNKNQATKILNIDKNQNLKNILGKPKPIQKKENQKDNNKKEEVENKKSKIIPQKTENKK